MGARDAIWHHGWAKNRRRLPVAQMTSGPRRGRAAQIASADEDPNVTPIEAASPPCFMHEVDPAYAGYLDRAELLELLNALLAGERAGAIVALEMSRKATDPDSRGLLVAVQRDEGRFCAMLSREIERLGGTPTRKVSPFRDKVLSLPGLQERLALLNRGQDWVVRRLREALPRVADNRLHEALVEMLATHERNVARCGRLLD